MNADNGAESKAENEAEKLTERQLKIITLINEDNAISREAISKRLGVGDSSVYRDIKKLKKIGKLKRVGADRGGHWKVN
jgi:ATP-dependent DNA helicase RecG